MELETLPLVMWAPAVVPLYVPGVMSALAVVVDAVDTTDKYAMVQQVARLCKNHKYSRYD